MALQYRQQLLDYGMLTYKKEERYGMYSCLCRRGMRVIVRTSLHIQKSIMKMKLEQI